MRTTANKSTNKLSRQFRITRAQDLQQSAEDYTELVLDLIEANGEARTCDIAKNLGISHVTAIRTIKRLQRDGYLETESRKPVFLTKQGLELAKKSKRRHQLVVNFLKALGVPIATAELDAEGIEHHVSKLTLKAMERFIKSD